MEIAWVLSVLGALAAGYFVGHNLREIREKISSISLPPKKEETPVSSLVDPLDEVQEAKREFTSKLKELNDDF